MKLLLLSDTHGAIDRFEVALKMAEKSEINLVVHAGDFAFGRVAEVMKLFPEMQFKIARGNADTDEEMVREVQKLANVELGEVVFFKAGGKQFAISHFESVAENEAKKQGKTIDIFVHGHTHRAEAREENGVAVINPGSLYEDPYVWTLRLPEMKLERKIFEEV
ncbi:MAG: metallophosphatase family protein [Candidatus Gracilibacteria bacterium]|nr:metallophosphatase family protein [Candidatus Gracilibacteria bacterium]